MKLYFLFFVNFFSCVASAESVSDVLRQAFSTIDHELKPLDMSNTACIGTLRAQRLAHMEKKEQSEERAAAFVNSLKNEERAQTSMASGSVKTFFANSGCQTDSLGAPQLSEQTQEKEEQKQESYLKTALVKTVKELGRASLVAAVIFIANFHSTCDTYACHYC